MIVLQSHKDIRLTFDQFFCKYDIIRKIGNRIIFLQTFTNRYSAQQFFNQKIKEQHT